MYIGRHQFSEKKLRKRVKKSLRRQRGCYERGFCAWEGNLNEDQRVFIAIELSPDVRKWLEKARVVLEPLMPSGAVRWVHLDGIHITLKFLGEIPANRIDDVRGAMDRSVKGVKPFPLAVEGLGCFPDLHRPRVVWAGVRREPLLEDLQRRLEEALAATSFPKERRAFSPHLTLGRVKDGLSADSLPRVGSAVEKAVMEKSVEMRVSEVILFRSVLRPSGAEYSVLYRTAFNQ
jgi:2'-5' RNA ligase